MPDVCENTDAFVSYLTSTLTGWLHVMAERSQWAFLTSERNVAFFGATLVIINEPLRALNSSAACCGDLEAASVLSV